MTKFLFLCLWYCSIYPGAFFMCAFAFGIKYFVDRFSLMRTWKRPPKLGTRVSRFSRRWFFSLAVLFMFVMSSYYWSGFPYDNICANESTDQSYNGTYKVTSFDNSTAVDEIVTYTIGTDDYRFCLQDFLSPGRDGSSFPFIPANQPEGEEWMTTDQESITTIFGWSAVGIIAFVLMAFCWRWIQGLKTLVSSTYKVRKTKRKLTLCLVSTLYLQTLLVAFTQNV